MTNPKEELLNILEDLTSCQFGKFKWYLKEPDTPNGFSAIRLAQLEDADRKDTVDLMVQKYTCRALKRTETILEKIDRNDLIPTSSKQKDCKKPNCGPEKVCQQKKAKDDFQSIQQYAVEVTLDPDTAYPALILSEDGKRVHTGDVRQTLPSSPKRFNRGVNVLGKQSITSGKCYYEVRVKGKTAWTVGVARESINRKGNISANPKNGYWTITLNEEEYTANADDQVCLSLKSAPLKVGVFVDYEKGLVSFYNSDTAEHLYSFTGCGFTENLLPFFSPCTNNGGRNAAPLIICPVNQTPNIRTCVSKEDCERQTAELKSIQQFAVEVTLDPDTAHRALILSEDGKRVRDSNVRQKLPFSRKRFNRCGNVLGKQSISSGKAYYEVQVKGKTAWTVGVASESISRRDQITLGPDTGFWTLSLRNEDEYAAIDNPIVSLWPKSQLQKVGVFVDYREGLISFYNSDTAERLYSFTGWRFTENLLPFFSPCTNDGGENSAPLIISAVSHSVATETHDSSDQEEDCERQKAELKSIQQYAVEVTLDPDTAYPALILSEDGKRVHAGDVRQKLPSGPKRFDRGVNVFGKQSITSGKCYYEVQVKGKTAWTVGVARESINRKGNISANPKNGYWTIMLNEEEYTANADDQVCLSLKSAPLKVGVFVDYEKGLVSFYNSDTAEHLYSFTGCSFTENLLPFFSPCTNDRGRNAAPLIICPVNQTPNIRTCVSKKDYERQTAELKSIQQFAVEVTLDPDTAHPALILYEDGKRVHTDDVRQKLPFSPKRFNRCVNVLGKQSISSGKAYFEVQAKGKTAWTVGVASESIYRKGQITLGPDTGFWTLSLRNKDDYTSNDDPAVRLSPRSAPLKVGVFVDYEEGLVSFYNSDTAERLYSFTGWSFTENLLPYFSPCTNDGGENSAPLIISTVSHSVATETQKVELKSIHQYAVEVTLDPDTAHPAVILSEDGKQVHAGDVRQKLPFSPKRFNSCVNVLGKQSISSGKAYFEVQVKGKTAWDLGIGVESIDRKGNITLSPEEGIWTICLRNGDKYSAIDNPIVSLSPKSQLQKIGVFVDYREGLISFYNSDTTEHLYSFTGCCFTENLLPFFSPCTNDSGRNTAPLIICPVNRTKKDICMLKALHLCELVLILVQWTSYRIDIPLTYPALPKRNNKGLD